MISSTTKTIAFAAALLFLPLSANAYHTNLLKGRVGYLDLKNSIASGSNGNASNQKISKGPIGEVSLTRFITSNIAAEVGLGCAFIKTKGNSDSSKKNSHIIPLNAALQFHLPIQNTFVPYVGIGYTYNIVQHSSTNLKINKSGNLLYQIGLDAFIFNDMGLNLDVKYSKVKHNLTDKGEKFKAKFTNLTTMVGVTIPF
jgi:outer membrane protein W